MLVMQPVLETFSTRDFTLWPMAEVGHTDHLVLDGDLSPDEVAAGVMRIAACNDLDPEHAGRPPRPGDPLGSFLHGLLTFEDLYVAGGLRVTDTIAGITFAPGCCHGIEEWRTWYDVIEGDGQASFGHDPDPAAERVGKDVRLIVDYEQGDSPVIGLSVVELRRLVEGAERDLRRFLGLATSWVDTNLPAHAAAVNAVLPRALGL